MVSQACHFLVPSREIPANDRRLPTTDFLRVLIRVSRRLIPRNMTRVVFEKVVRVFAVHRVCTRGVGISPHGLEWQRLYGESIRSVKVHVLLIPIDEEEVVAGPARRQRWKLRRIELQRDLVSRTEDRQES